MNKFFLGIFTAGILFLGANPVNAQSVQEVTKNNALVWDAVTKFIDGSTATTPITYEVAIIFGGKDMNVPGTTAFAVVSVADTRLALLQLLQPRKPGVYAFQVRAMTDTDGAGPSAPVYSDWTAPLVRFYGSCLEVPGNLRTE